MATRPTTYSPVFNTTVNGKFTVDMGTTTGLTFGVTAGDYQINGEPVEVPAQTITLADNTDDQLVLFSRNNGGLSLNNTDTGVVAIYKVSTSSGAITSITDLRSAYI